MVKYKHDKKTRIYKSKLDPYKVIIDAKLEENKINYIIIENLNIKIRISELEDYLKKNKKTVILGLIFVFFYHIINFVLIAKMCKVADTLG